MRSALKAKFALFSAIALWASAYVGIRYGIQFYSAGAMALFRYGVASVCIFPLYLHYQSKLGGWKSTISSLLLGILGIAVYNVTLNLGEKTVSAGVASFIISLTPVVVTALAVLFYKEQLTWKIKLGFIISLVGMFFILLGEDSFSFLKQDLNQLCNLGWIFVAMLAGSFFFLLQKPLLKTQHPVEFTAYAIWGGTLALLVYLPDFIQEIQISSLFPKLTIIYLGIFPGIIAYSCWSYALSTLPITYVMSYEYCIPFATLLISAIFLREWPSLLTLIGGGIAVMGALLIMRAKIRIPINLP